MKKISFTISQKPTHYYFDAPFEHLKKLVDQSNSVLITDENVFDRHKSKFKGWNTIVLKAGEEFKVQATADAVIEQLIEMGADRKTWLVGVGGGVITDLTGYIAALYMRGIGYGFVPTTVLAMVDAAIGGKNGVNVGLYKNLVGAIRQPEFLLYDFSLLKTLPANEWASGFAEIIKHACIQDATMFKQLEKNDLSFYKKDIAALATLVRRNALLKCKIAQSDEHEMGNRRLLNFGHTLGHALENIYELTHGQAISIGMVAAARVSQNITGFSDTSRVMSVLKKYKLPVNAAYDTAKVFNLMKMDKKKEKDTIHYVMLKKIGQGDVQQVPMVQLEKMINDLV